MAELFGLDLGAHLEAIVSEFAARESIYGYPKRKMWFGFDGVDFSTPFHDKVAATPLGPASGPHTQLAQNIVLSFLGGGRIMELKTVQIKDRLEIPRPCIDVRNIGFNVEWSQELRLADSFREYVTAWVLLKLIEELEILGISKGDPFYRTVFDVSAGYDLAGISSPEMHQWLSDIRNAEAEIAKTLETLPPKFAHLKKLPIDPRIADSVTLSTFHGCPRDEIEAIVKHLIGEHGFHVIVKMNPTILGYEFVRKTVCEDLGYRHIQLDPAAFEHDLQFDEGAAMMKRLEKFAAQHGRKVGAKFTNTLVVKNHDRVFSDAVMYLSGAPLHVLAMNAMHKFRGAVGEHLHISFSAGINKQNFADAVRCNMKPITTCTDLLKTGGYTRMFDYLKNLQKEMLAGGSHAIADFIRHGAGGKTSDLNHAGMINARRIVPMLVENPRYHFEKNQKAPPKRDSHLVLFDCITCNKCLPVCPNAANFSIPSSIGELTISNYQLNDGNFVPIDGGKFVIAKDRQIANLADFCNECGDCDTYCPEHGGPFIEKPRFFSSKETYEMFSGYDGFYFANPNEMIGRIEGREYSLAVEDEHRRYRWRSTVVDFTLDENGRLLTGKTLANVAENVQIDLTPFWIMKTLFEGLAQEPAAYPAIVLKESTNGSR